jgi:predicted metal-dependent hydrolase
MATLKIDNFPIPYRIRISKRARRLRLVVTAEGIEVVVPPGVAAGVVDNFIVSRHDWLLATYRDIVTRVERFGGPAQWTSGARIPFRGEQQLLSIQATRDATIRVIHHAGEGFEVQLPDSVAPERREQVVKVTMVNWLKGYARRDVETYADHYSRAMQRYPRRIRIKEQKNLWGSCGKNDEININWRLILAPQTVLEYVVVHELCHLFHRNHSGAFWQLVGQHLPDYQSRRNWLKSNGAALMWEI